MRYHHTVSRSTRNDKKHVYFCEHPVYSRCSLIKRGDKGLCIVEQKYSAVDKSTKWAEVKENLLSDILANDGFNAYFNQTAEEPKNGLYPTITVRQIMWALRMKPLKKRRWETVFDRRRV